GGDRERGEHARDHIRLWDTDHHRIAAGLAGEAHDPAHPLNDEVVRGPRAARSILAEPADVTQHGARVDRANAFVGESESRERPGTEVLDHDIALLDEP